MNIRNYFQLITVLLAVSSCAIFSNKDTAGKFPIYGNWCGPQHPKAGTNPDPINRTDLACKNHDLCYDEKGYFNSSCDQQIVTELKSFVPDDEVEAVARKEMIAYFREVLKL